jgi:hypothetical protein
MLMPKVVATNRSSLPSHPNFANFDAVGCDFAISVLNHESEIVDVLPGWRNW